jgi:hypothetical protein
MCCTFQGQKGEDSSINEPSTVAFGPSPENGRRRIRKIGLSGIAFLLEDREGIN